MYIEPSLSVAASSAITQGSVVSRSPNLSGTKLSPGEDSATCSRRCNRCGVFCALACMHSRHPESFGVCLRECSARNFDSTGFPAPRLRGPTHRPGLRHPHHQRSLPRPRPTAPGRQDRPPTQMTARRFPSPSSPLSWPPGAPNANHRASIRPIRPRRVLGLTRICSGSGGPTTPIGNVVAQRDNFPRAARGFANAWPQTQVDFRCSARSRMAISASRLSFISKVAPRTLHQITQPQPGEQFSDTTSATATSPPEVVPVATLAERMATVRNRSWNAPDADARDAAPRGAAPCSASHFCIA